MEPDTETNDMDGHGAKIDSARSYDLWGWLENFVVSRGKYLWVITGGLAFLLVIIGILADIKILSVIAQVVLLAGGGFQIFLGVYLTRSQRDFISDFIEQEEARPTVLVRDVMLTREIIRIVKRLKECGPGLTQAEWDRRFDSIISRYESRKNKQKSKSGERLDLSPKDVAKALQSAFTHAFFGTLMALAGTLIAIIPESWF